MAKIHGIFCCLFLTSVLIIERAGGMGGRMGWGEKERGGWGGRSQNPLLGTPHEQP